jgi:uncharacterized membrane protein YhhN
MNIIFFALYSLVAFINIFSIQYEKSFVRFISKICLMPILMFFYIFNSDTISFIIIMAIIFSWCGDILLINPNKLKLYAGILSFLFMHIMYIIGFICLLSEINIMIFILSFFLIFLIEISFIMKLHIPNNHNVAIVIYGITIGLLIIFSLQVFICCKNTGSILLLAGSILFFISDAVLLYFDTIKAMTKNSLTVIMLTYIVAQICIVFGYMNI